MGLFQDRWKARGAAMLREYTVVHKSPNQLPPNFLQAKSAPNKVRVLNPQTRRVVYILDQVKTTEQGDHRGVYRKRGGAETQVHVRRGMV